MYVLKPACSVREKLATRFSKRALILLYHRVSEAESDPWGLAVSPTHFAEHLEILRQYAPVIPLSKLLNGRRRSGVPRRAVIITFDDGYADNLFIAKPLLEQLEMPATAFITTGYVGENREFWWDELDRLLLEPAALPRTLRIRKNGSYCDWQISESVTTRDRSWRAWQKEEAANSRHTLYHDVWELMQPMAESERLRIRNELLGWAGSNGMARPSHRPLDAQEIVQLSDGGLIEIGCHTVTHPKLAALNVESQRDEIHQSKTRLEEILNHPVTSFAYPYGGECDFSCDTISLLREAGFDCGCTTSIGIVTRQSDLFKLPRLQVPDVDGESFARLLANYI